KTFLVEAFQIPSGSMERTLLAGDFLFVNKAVYGAQIPGTKARLPGFESPRRGDVIVFAYPKNPELNYVKRVIGAPGDTVEMRGGEVRVNGDPLAEQGTAARRVFQLRPGGARRAPLVDRYSLAPARLDHSLEPRPGSPGPGAVRSIGRGGILQRALRLEGD